MLSRINKKFLICLTLILSALGPFSSNVFAEEKIENPSIIEANQRIDKIKDFKEDKDSAKKWAEKEFEKWNKDLKPDQKKAFEEVKKESFNASLQIFGVDLAGLSSENKKNKEEQLKSMEKIDKALSSKNAKLNESLKVYQNLNAKELSRELKDEAIFLSNGQIDAEQYKSLKESLIGMRYESYKIADLAYTPDNTKGFKLEISLPKGENVGYAFENQVVLQKDKALEVTKMSQIVEKGKKKIKIEAKLVEKDKIDQKIIEEQKKDNQEINEWRGFPEETQLLDYRFSSAKAEYYSESIKGVFWETNDRIGDLFKDVIDYMEEGNGKFYFVDRWIATFPEAYLPDPITDKEQGELWSVVGLTYANMREIFIDIREVDAVDTFVHEVGHMVDRMLGQKMGEGEEGWISDIKEFREVFTREGANLTDYGSTDAGEFFAEAFRMYYSNDLKEKEQLQKDAPETYEFIEKYMNELINN